MIDSHCHIAGPEFTADLDAVVARAGAAGLAHAFVILAADDEPELARASDVARAWPDACMGADLAGPVAVMGLASLTR